eukprot:626864-Pelagomonas_calceolata.AAC.3
MGSGSYEQYPMPDLGDESEKESSQAPGNRLDLCARASRLKKGECEKREFPNLPHFVYPRCVANIINSKKWGDGMHTIWLGRGGWPPFGTSEGLCGPLKPFM